MEIPQEVDDFIKNSIDHTLGLEVPNHALQLKLQSLEASNYTIRRQYLALKSELKAKDEAIERVRAEASMNAQALKRFIEENQKLAAECANLVSQCSRLERECSLYDRDREALMEFGNEAHERAKEAEIRANELEEEWRRVSVEAQMYKQQCERSSAASREEGTLEQDLVDELISTLVNGDHAEKLAHVFLESSSKREMCQNLLKMWESLRPATRNIISLAAQLQVLQKDNEHLTVNLHRAEEEVKVLFEENNVLDEENKRLRHYTSQKKHRSSGGKHGSSTTKSNKRKTSPTASSPIGRKIEFGDIDSPRQPLSPLKENSPDSRMCKK